MDCATKTIKQLYFSEVSNIATNTLKRLRVFLNGFFPRCWSSWTGLPATPAHAAEGGRAAVLPSGLARVRSCCWCPSNWPLRRKPLPVTGPCLRTRLPYWTDPGARETDGHHPSDWKTAGRQNPAGIRNCANGFDLSARRHLFAQSMACSRLFGLIRALELFTGPCGARDERDGTLPRVPDLLGSPLDRVTFPEQAFAQTRVVILGVFFGRGGNLARVWCFFHVSIFVFVFAIFIAVAKICWERERPFNQDDLVYIKHVDVSFINTDCKTLHACRLKSAKAQLEAMQNTHKCKSSSKDYLIKTI